MSIIDLQRPRRRQRAFTITEMWFGMVLGSILGVAMLSFTTYAAKSFAALANYVELEQKSQIALDTMTRDIRQVNCLSNFGTMTLNGQTITNSLTFLDSDGQALTYNYTNQVLLRTKGTVSRMILTNCDTLSFQIYQRNTIPNNYDQYNAGDVTTCKQISVNWICSRTILGSKLNTESVQTAKIVIRKE